MSVRRGGDSTDDGWHIEVVREKKNGNLLTSFECNKCTFGKLDFHHGTLSTCVFPCATFAIQTTIRVFYLRFCCRRPRCRCLHVSEMKLLLLNNFWFQFDSSSTNFQFEIKMFYLIFENNRLACNKTSYCEWRILFPASEHRDVKLFHIIAHCLCLFCLTKLHNTLLTNKFFIFIIDKWNWEWNRE